MDYTKVPRELIYSDRKFSSDFRLGDRETLNGQLSLLMRRFLFIELGRNDYQAIIIHIMNEAYYPTTMLLKDDNADDMFNEYVKSVLKESPYPEDITNIFRRLVLALSYIYLERASMDSLKVRTVRRHLRNHAFEFIYLNSEIVEFPHPAPSEFKMRKLTEELVSNVNWKDVTNNYRTERVKEILDYLGDSKTEKRLLIIAIYRQMISSDYLSSVPYSTDNLLLLRYREAGGKMWDLVSIHTKEHPNIQFPFDNMSKAKPLSTDMVYDQMRQRSRLETLEKENRELKQHNRLLTEELYALRENIKQQQATKLGHDELEQREASLKEQIREMNSIINNLQKKLGNKAIQLKYIVESIKNKADFVGLKDAYYLFEQIDLMLIEEPVWRENRSELVSFFRERNKQQEKTPGVMFLDNHGIVNNK